MGIFSLDDNDFGPPAPPRCFVCGRKSTDKYPLDHYGDVHAHKQCQESAQRIWDRAERKGQLSQRIALRQTARPGMREYIDAVAKEYREPEPTFYVGQTIRLVIGEISGLFQLVAMDPESGRFECEPVQAEVRDLIGHEVDQPAWDDKIKGLMGE